VLYEDGKTTGGSKSGASASSNQDLDLIPVDSDVVLGLDLAKAQQSALFRDYGLPMLTRSADAQQVIEALKSKCNIDPMTAAKRLTGGFKLAGRRVTSAVLVVHGVEKAKALPCVDQVKEQLAAGRIEVTRDGDVVMMKSDRGELAFTFTGDDTALVVGGAKANKAGVLEIAQGKSALKSSPEFADMYGRLDTSHTAWGLVKGDLPMLARQLSSINVTSKAVFGSANTDDGLALHVNVRTGSEEQAANLAELANSQADTAKGMTTKFEAVADKADFRATVALNPEQLKNAVRMLGVFIR
jgi:hypothetical protein